MKLRQWLRFIVLQFCLMLFISCQSQDQARTAETAEHQTELTTEQRLENINSALKLVKAEMAKDGSYNCCVQPTCDWCLLKEGECGCYDNLKADKEVCPGCGLGWHNGKGVVQGIDARKVKWNITHEHGHAGEHGEDDHDDEDKQHKDEHRH